jgi:DNA-binding MarR family transcriptional regulator
MTTDTQTDQSPEGVAAQRYENLLELSPSCKLVFYALRQVGEPLNIQQLAEETLLPRRTIRYALTKLSNHGLIDKQPSLQDARKTKYMLHEAPCTTNDPN